MASPNIARRCGRMLGLFEVQLYAASLMRFAEYLLLLGVLYL
jgi:hypothetical protein